MISLFLRYVITFNKQKRNLQFIDHVKYNALKTEDGWIHQKLVFLHFYWFQMSTIFFSFCIFSQMLVNSLLTISFLGESLGFMLTHDVFSFVLAFIPTKIFKITDEPLLPFQDFDTIKLRWNRFLMDSTDFSFYHIVPNMIKKL